MENIILVAGRDGGGTATFQNHLVRYLISANENFSAELVLADERDGLDIQDQWRAFWSEGGLPKGAGQPKDYAYRVQPLRQHKDKPPLNFAFREISGTDLDPLPEDLRALLGDPELNFVLVLVCGRNEKESQDAPLARFIASLKSADGGEFASRCPVLLLASKAREDDGDDQGVEAFLGDNLPATLAALQDWQGRYTLGEFDAGEFEFAEDGEPLLCAPKFEDAAKIFPLDLFPVHAIPRRRAVPGKALEERPQGRFLSSAFRLGSHRSTDFRRRHTHPAPGRRFSDGPACRDRNQNWHLFLIGVF